MQDGSKIITGMRIIRSSDNVKTSHLITNEDDDKSKSLHAFFLNSKEFGKNKDCYVTTSEKEINVFDKN